LQSISLSNTFLQDLNHIAALNFLPTLTELRIAGIPALSELTGKVSEKFQFTNSELEY